MYDEYKVGRLDPERVQALRGEPVQIQGQLYPDFLENVNVRANRVIVRTWGEQGIVGGMSRMVSTGGQHVDSAEGIVTGKRKVAHVVHFCYWMCTPRQPCFGGAVATMD